MFLQGLVQLLPNMFGYLDQNEVCRLVNPAYASRLGSTVQNMLNQPIRPLVGEENYAKFGPLVKRCLRGETCFVDSEYKDVSGEQKYSRLQYTPHIVEGQVLGCFVVAIDITSAKQQEAILIQSSKLVSIGEMSASIAHEINNPLSLILGNTELLERRIKSIEGDHTKLLNLVASITKTANRIAKIARGFRMMSRHTEKDPHETVPVQELLDSVMTFCEKRIIHENIKFSKPENLTDSVFGSPVEMSQILINLLNNAYDSVLSLPENEPRWIRINYHVGAGEVAVLSVEDSGPVMSELVVKKLFTSFFTTKEPGKGTGLGLNISQTLAQRNGGRLYFDRSCPNTCFVVELPLKDQSIENAA